MSRHALIYDGQAQATMDKLFHDNRAKWQQVDSELRAFANNPYAGGAPKIDSNGVAEITKRGLFRATCFVATNARGGGVVTTVRMMVLH